MSGMDAFDKLFKRPEYHELIDEDTLAEECMLAWMIWDDIHQITERKLPEDYALKWFVDKGVTNEIMMKMVRKQFKRLLMENK